MKLTFALLFIGLAFHEEKNELLDYLYFPDGGVILPVQRRNIFSVHGS